MGLFNFLNNKNKSNSSSTEQATKWQETGKGTKLAEQSAAAAELQRQANQLHQEDKLIAAMLYGQSLGDQAPTVTDSERTTFYQKLLSHEIGDRQESNLLQTLATPAHDPATRQLSRTANVLDTLSSIHHQRILSYMTGGDFNKPNPDPDSVARFLTTYPTPVEFSKAEDKLMEMIYENNPGEKYQAYLKDMESFKDNIYGKRQEYHRAFNSLQSKAMKHAHEAEARRKVDLALRAQNHDPYKARVIFEDNESQ